MNHKPIIFAIAVAVTLAAGAFAFRSWLQAHDDRMALRATLDAQKQLIGAAEQREQQRRQDLNATLAQIEELKRQTQTPQQIVRELPQYLPLPQPIQLVPPTPQQGTGPSPEQARLPNGQARLPSGQGTALPAAAPPASKAPAADSAPAQDKSFAQIPAADLKPLYDFVQDCRACQAQLAAARANLNDERAKSAALAAERDAAVKAAKGGSFWTRLKRNAKWLAVGAGLGYAAAHAH